MADKARCSIKLLAKSHKKETADDMRVWVSRGTDIGGAYLVIMVCLRSVAVAGGPVVSEKRDPHI